MWFSVNCLRCYLTRSGWLLAPPWNLWVIDPDYCNLEGSAGLHSGYDIRLMAHYLVIKSWLIMLALKHVKTPLSGHHSYNAKFSCCCYFLSSTNFKKQKYGNNKLINWNYFLNQLKSKDPELYFSNFEEWDKITATM